MKPIPTAEELLRNNFLLIEDDKKTCEAHTHLVVKQMIEFAKIHVEAALKQAMYKADEKELSSMEVNEYYRNSILNAYPLTLIK